MVGAANGIGLRQGQCDRDRGGPPQQEQARERKGDVQGDPHSQRKSKGDVRQSQNKMEEGKKEKKGAG